LTSEYAASHTDENIQEIKGRKNWMESNSQNCYFLKTY